MNAHRQTLTQLAAGARARGLMLRASGDPNNILTELNAAFGQFRSANDATLAELRAGLDDVNLRLRAGDLNGQAGAYGLLSASSQRAVAALGQFAKTGDSAVMAALNPQSSAHKGSDPDGGYLVPDEISSTIISLQRDISPLRRLARVVPTRSHSYSQPINRNGTASGWVSERGPRPETEALDLAMLDFPSGEIYANPAVTQQLLDDNDFNLGSFLVEEISKEFDQQEGASFVVGTGRDQPQGFLTYPTYIGKANATFMQIEAVKTGDGTTLGTSTAAGDKLIDLLHSMKAPHRRKSTWLMNSTTQGTVSKLKDGDGNYLWQRALTAGSPDMLLGRPVELDENMPDIGAGAYPIALGNWSDGYLINDRMGVRVLRDPYSNKPYVMFYATKRVGGGVLDAEAIKLLKVAA